MRVACLIAILALGALDSARAAPEVPDDPESVADAFQAALEAGDRERAVVLAERGPADPWRVADVLRTRAGVEVAVVWAEAAQRPAFEGLKAYVTREGVGDSLAALRRRVEEATRHLAARETDAGLAALEGAALSQGSVPAVLAHRVRGRVLQAQRRHEEAAGAFAASREAASGIGWKTAVALAGEQEARSLIRRGDLEAADVAARRWLDCERSLRSARGVGRAQGLVALVASRRGAYDEALRCAGDALEAADASGDEELAASALTTRGFVAYARGDVAAAHHDYEEALGRLDAVTAETTLERFRVDRELLVRQRVSLRISAATFAFRRGEPPRAQVLLHDAMDAAREAGMPDLLAQALLVDGALHQASGEAEQALEQFEAALEAQRAAGDRAGEVGVRRRIGQILQSRGDHPRALDMLGRALEVQLVLGDRRESIFTRLAIASSLEATGEVDAALRALGEAESTARELGLTTVLGEVRLAVAGLEMRHGRYARALSLLEVNLAAQRRAENPAGIAAGLRLLATLRARLRDDAAALVLLEESREVAEAAGEVALRADALRSLGTVRLRLGDPEAAVAALQEARGVYASLNDMQRQAETLTILGAAERARGRYADAVARSEEALLLHASLGNTGDAAVARLNAALARVEQGDTDAAIENLSTALARSEEGADVEAEVQCLWGLAYVHLRRGDWEEVVRVARRGIEALARLGRHLAEGEGAGARATFAPLFEIGAEASLRAQDLVSLHHFLESGRAGTFLAALGGRDALRALVVPEALRTREAEARAAEAVAQARFAEARAARNLKAARARRSELRAAAAHFQEVVASIQRELRAEAGLVYPRARTLREVQAVLDSSDVLVVYALLYESTYALVLTRDAARVVGLGATAQVVEVCESVLLEEKPFVDEDAVDAARQRLITSLLLPADKTRLLVAPDGILGYLPFGLLAPTRDVTYVPSGSVLVELSALPAAGGTEILALGDPVYGETSGGAATRGRALAPLPATRKEVEAIGDVLLLGAHATEGKLREALRSRSAWRAVHLACHGLIDSEEPTRSSLALTADEANDGFLTALDVFRLRIPADLVVLSACETGRGKVVRGEGVIGLTRAFMFAGAPRVLVSLWQVDDEATRALMERFYALWNPDGGATGLSAAEALREAQAHVRTQERWRHPYYWAAWVLWGLPD